MANPAPNPTPHVTPECGPPAVATQPLPTESPLLFPDVPASKVYDITEELRKIYRHTPNLQTSMEWSELGGGYCTAWSLWIQTKLIKLSAHDYWDLDLEDRLEVYKKVIYGGNDASDPDETLFKPPSTLVMRTELEKTLNPGMWLRPPPIRSPFTIEGETPMQSDFKVNVMNPAILRNPDTPFYWFPSGNLGYHIVYKKGSPWFGEFMELNRTKHDPKPILFNVSMQVKNSRFNHALCCVYFPKSHEIDVITTYVIEPTMNKNDIIEARYQPVQLNVGQLNFIERYLHLPITKKTAGRRKTFRKRSSARKTRKRKTRN
jgi:hypothetical protein